MEDIEDPLASNKQRPGAADPSHYPDQKAPLSPLGLTATILPAAAPNQDSEQNDDQSTAHHQGTGDTHACGDEEGEEMDTMDQDEVEFLEGNAQLGSLRSGKIIKHYNI